MLKKTYLNKLKSSLHDYAKKRHEVIKLSSDALHLSKRAIFAMHRDERAEAATKLSEARNILTAIEKAFKKTPDILHEGSYHAALEEFVEATLLFQFISSGSMGEELKGVSVSRDVYLAGMCDVPGELYRMAIKAATAKDVTAVTACNAMAQEIIEALTEFEFTKYLRNKFDQAKQAAHKLEYVVYEVSLRS